MRVLSIISVTVITGLIVVAQGKSAIRSFVIDHNHLFAQ